MVVWPLWQWIYVAEESYLFHDRQAAERGKRLGTQRNFQSHTPVTCFLHLYPPTKFPQPHKATPPAEDQSFPTRVCSIYFILKPSQIVMHPVSCLRYLGDSMEMSDFCYNACPYWNITLIFIKFSLRQLLLDKQVLKFPSPITKDKLLLYQFLL